jgi:hypothetical protein
MKFLHQDMIIKEVFDMGCDCCCCGDKKVDMCESCGMPMQNDELRGGKQPENKCCVHCCDAEGKLKSKEEVREGMISYYVEHEGKSKEDAETFVDEYMTKMPAWK